MPSHQLRVTAGAELREWQDPATTDTPSRLNPVQRHPHKYWRLITLVPCTIKAIVDGVEGPPDGDLGGRLFAWSWVATPELGYSPPIPTLPGFTSVAVLPETNDLKAGHYELLCSRPSGGAVGIGFEIEG